MKLKSGIFRITIPVVFAVVAGICYAACGEAKDSSMVLSEQNDIIEQNDISGQGYSSDENKPTNEAVMNNELSKAEESASEIQSTEDYITVHICGAVIMPGVYAIHAGARLIEGINAAGGITDNADADIINLAQVLYDGQRVYVPCAADTANMNENERTAGTDAVSSGRLTGKVNINTATAEELMTLTGIGKSRADDIIEYRSNNGFFECIEDIMKVNGIKEAAYKKISENICVG